MPQNPDPFSMKANMTYAEALQRRGRSRHNSLRSFTVEDYKTYDELMQAVLKQTKISKQMERKPYWLQAREVIKQMQNDSRQAIRNSNTVRKPATPQMKFDNYVGILEAVENARDRKLAQDSEPKSLADIARMRAKFSSYERIWIKLLYDAESKENPKSCKKFLKFVDVPWPLFVYPDNEEVFPDGREQILNFILHPDRIGIDKPHSEALIEARRLWDCDTIYDRLLSRVVPQDLRQVFIAYRRVWKAIGGLESMLKMRMPKTPISPGFPPVSNGIPGVIYETGSELDMKK